MRVPAAMAPPLPRAGNTPLHEAAYAGHAAMVEALLAAGANVNLQDGDGAGGGAEALGGAWLWEGRVRGSHAKVRWGGVRACEGARECGGRRAARQWANKKVWRSNTMHVKGGRLCCCVDGACVRLRGRGWTRVVVKMAS